MEVCDNVLLEVISVAKCRRDKRDPAESFFVSRIDRFDYNISNCPDSLDVAPSLDHGSHEGFNFIFSHDGS
jgi:hypothetical protein